MRQGFVHSHRVGMLATTSLLFLFCACGTALAQSGHVLDGVGPVDQSMAGATTALPLDAIGSVHRNPASITGLPCSEIGFAFAVFAPSTELSSTTSIPGLGPASGSVGSDTDISIMPAMGLVHRSDDSPWAYGIGGFAVGGFGVDFPDTSYAENPITSPALFGGIYSSFQMMQISTPIAYQVTDRVSVGFSPTFDWGALAVTPFPAATPDPVPPPNSYPNGARSDARWGLGFKLGVYYEDPCSGWHFGLSYTSTQWFANFKINSRHADDGTPYQLEYDMDYPSNLSLGVAYSGFERIDLSADLRYIDYENTDGFQDAGFDPTGAVTGFGWESIFVAAFGAQYHVCDQFRLRMGYAYNQTPVDGDVLFYNVASTAIVQHHLNAGFSWETNHNWTLSFAYHHGFKNSVSGPFPSPPMPPGSVGAELQTHTMVGSVSKRF